MPLKPNIYIRKLCLQFFWITVSMKLYFLAMQLTFSLHLTIKPCVLGVDSVRGYLAEYLRARYRIIRAFYIRKIWKNLTVQHFHTRVRLAIHMHAISATFFPGWVMSLSSWKLSYATTLNLVVLLNTSLCC